MKRVVLVAPEFPPLNSAGAHRPRLLAKHLPASGWTPTVITVRPECIEGPLDRLLERLVPPSLEIVRTGALPVRPIRLIGDLGLRTLPHHVPLVARACRSGTTDAVVLFGPPWFSFLVGPLACRPYGIPYVLDYIDPWLSEWGAERPFPSKAWAYHRLAAALEPVAVRSAAHITAVSDGILADLRRRYRWIPPGALSVIPYGADADDLDAAARLNITPPDFIPDRDGVNVCFTGALQPHGIEVVHAVLAALAELRRGDPELGSRLRLRCYGTSNITWGHGQYRILPAARALGVADMVSEIPERIPYLQAMAVLRASDVILVMGSWDHYYHASKLYPAIVSGKPILALCHRDASIVRVMAATGAGTCVTFDGPRDLAGRAPDIAAALRELLARGPSAPAPPEVLAPFTAGASAGVLAAALDRMAGARAADNGGARAPQPNAV